MTNREKYYDKLMDYALAGVKYGLDKNTRNLTLCDKWPCGECQFDIDGKRYNRDCGEMRLFWLNEECIEPEPKTDWSKVEVDTPVLVKDDEDDPWKLRHFAKYENGMTYCWSDGKTSYTAIGAARILNWTLVKLPTPEELEQYRKKV